MFRYIAIGYSIYKLYEFSTVVETAFSVAKQMRNAYIWVFPPQKGRYVSAERDEWILVEERVERSYSFT
jgi:hypothetical protein